MGWYTFETRHFPPSHLFQLGTNLIPPSCDGLPRTSSHPFSDFPCWSLSYPLDSLEKLKAPSCFYIEFFSSYPFFFPFSIVVLGVFYKCVPLFFLLLLASILLSSNFSFCFPWLCPLFFIVVSFNFHDFDFFLSFYFSQSTQPLFILWFVFLIGKPCSF